MKTVSTLSQRLLAALICTFLGGCFDRGSDSNGLEVNLVISGTVTKVHDGDSVHITPLGKKRVIVRLAAIDAPEVQQNHGIASRNYLRSMIMSKQVTARCNKVDKYKRQICVVLKDDQDINLEMLKTGKAWYYEKFSKEQNRRDQRVYRQAAKNAVRKKLGIWAEETAIPPWEFRAIGRN